MYGTKKKVKEENLIYNGERIPEAFIALAYNTREKKSLTIRRHEDESRTKDAVNMGGNKITNTMQIPLTLVCLAHVLAHVHIGIMIF